MRFLVDECTRPSVAQWLRAQGYGVVSVCEQERGLEDVSVLALAVREASRNRCLASNHAIILSI